MRQRLLTVLLCLPGVASANVFDVFGAGARSQSMAGALGALSADHLAAFHNPAGLVAGPPVVGLGFSGSFNRTSIVLTPRPAGYEPPKYGFRLRPRANTEAPPGVAGVTIGGSVRVLSDDLALGAVVFVPLDGFAASANTRFADEREQYFSNRLDFELLGSRMNNEVIALGLAYQLRPWLSMGIGMMILPGTEVAAPVYVPNASDLSNIDLNVEVKLKTTRALTAGVLIRPWDWLRVGVAFQDELWFAIDGASSVQLRGEEEDEPISQRLDLLTAYSPVRVTSAVAVELEDVVTATVETTFRAWSRYPDNHQVRAGFEDTFDVKLGIEWPVADSTFVRAGAGYVPSPVPAQTGRTNFVDNDRVVVGLGAGRDFQLFDFDLTLDVGFQVQTLIAQSVQKRVSADGRYPACVPGETRLCDEVPDRTEDSPLQPAAATTGLQTGNPGFPGYAHGGYIVGASIDLKWRF